MHTKLSKTFCYLCFRQFQLLNTSPFKSIIVIKKWVNVEELFKTKAPKVYKFLPGFLIRYIAKLVHEDDINDVINYNQPKRGVDFAIGCLERMGVTVEVDGLENIPPTGSYIFACNHPLGGLDGLAVISAISKVRRDIKYFVNELLLALKNMDNILVPVNINGKNSRKMLEYVEEVYASDIAVPIFPAGLVSRRQPDRSIKDLPWKKSFIAKAKQHKKDVIPVWVEGKNSDFFYNFAYWRKKLGIKINIEMFFLPDEMFKQRNQKIVVHFGKPISYSTFTHKHDDAKWALLFQDELYKKKATIVRQPLFENAAAL
jgi:putative hemolysin